MNFLLVYSHPYPKSFNHAITQTLANELTGLGQHVRVRDLYALGFDPVLKESELKGFAQGEFPADIKEEQSHIRWSDMVVLICPIWWGGFTAQLRGYLDRVFSNGFAYRETAAGIEKLLKDKKVFTINTIGAPAHVYEKAGFFKSMDQLLDGIAFDFCGIRVAGHKYFGGVGSCSDQERQAMLSEVRSLAKGWVAHAS